MSKLKTVWDAVNEFEASLPIAMNGEWSFDYTNTCTVIGYSYDGEAVCTKAEFNALVDSMSRHAGDEIYERYVRRAKTPLAKETKVDYTSTEFWKNAPEGCNAFMPESKDWHASWFSLRNGKPKLMIRIDCEDGPDASCYDMDDLMSDGLILHPQLITTETPEEKEALDNIVNKSLVYTQEMYDNNELASIGMICRHLGVKKKVTAPLDVNNKMVLTSVANGIYSLAHCDDIYPIDTHKERKSY